MLANVDQPFELLSPSEIPYATIENKTTLSAIPTMTFNRLVSESISPPSKTINAKKTPSVAKHIIIETIIDAAMYDNETMLRLTGAE